MNKVIGEGGKFPNYFIFGIMRKLALILVLVLCGCENEFTPYNPVAKPVPIVFGFVDDHDSIHTVRLTKTFTGSADAYELAKDTSKLLYDSVKMIIICMDINYKIIDTLTFHKTYFTPPATGNFNTGKSWYYVSTDKFPTGDNFTCFRLKVFIYDSGDSVRSYLIPRTKYRVEIRMPDKRSKNISVYNEKITEIRFAGNPTCGVKIRFNYSEVSNDVKTEKSIEKFWYNTNGLIYLSPAKLFMFIKNAIPENPDVDFRVFKNLDFLFYSETTDAIFYYLVLFNSDKSSFSSVNFFETVYQDIANGYGMFYWYTKDSVTGLKFDDKTLDSLAAGQYTKNLKFVPYQ